ncbi:MAG: TonB-dependent receptor [Bacteroidales bacterium]
MKIIPILFILTISSLWASETYSQIAQLNLRFENTKVSEVLREIEDQSEFYFLYNPRIIDVEKVVTINVEDKNINDVLPLILGEGLRYAIYDRQIIITQKNETLIPNDFQQKTIRGKVLDSRTQEPIPGVNIVIKNTNTGVITDASGNFSLLGVDGTSVLVFSFIGYTPQEVQVGESASIEIFLVESISQLDEIVVTGYQTQKKVDMTGAISVVDVEALIDIPTTNPMQAVQGRIPGLYIETTGSPSGETRTLLIRGKNTLGNTDPLYVIDGVPTKQSNAIQSLDPNSIESIQVLKDASAASIYGARASNGVIIVTTKKGRKGLQVEISSNMTVQNYSWLNKVDMCNTIERGKILWQAAINDKTDPIVHKSLYTYEYHNDAQGNPVLDKVIPVEWIGGNPNDQTKAQIPGTDWQNVAYRNALQSNSHLTISGATDNTSALLGIGYVFNEGILKYTDFNKYSVRLNTSHSLLNGKLIIGENLQLSKTSETRPGGDLGSPLIPLGRGRLSGGNMHELSVTLQPILPVYREDGEWAGPLGSGFSDRNNVLHMLYIHRNNKWNDFTTFGNLYAELNPIKDLKLRSSFGIDYVDSYGTWFEEEYTEGFLRKDINSLDVLQQHNLNWTWSNTIGYNLLTGKHSFDLIMGMEAIKNNYYSLGARKLGFAIQDNDYRFLDAGTGSQTNTGSSTGHQLLSYFGKVNYGYSDRYLGSLTLRYDGFSRFGTDNRYGLFPALTVGWRINNEAFFNIPVISNLKLRAGIGRVGNQEIGDMARFGLYATNYGAQSGARNTGTAYDLNGSDTGTLPSGFVSVQTENNSLRWESTDEFNIGFDFGFFEERIIGSFDFFTRVTNDILIKPPVASVVGEGGQQWLNGATIKNNGFEIVLGYRNIIGNFSYNISGALSSFHDKITELPAAVVRSYPGNVEKTILGHSQTSVFGYVTDGIFQTQEEVNLHAIQAGKGVGRIRYADLNNDGKIDPLDQDWLGTTLPDFEYGINGELGYKNLTLSFFIQGVSGKEVYNSMKGMLTMTHAGSSGMNFGRDTFSGWTPTNTNTNIPAQSLVNNNNETRSSDYFYVNGSYLKMRSLQISYNMPLQLIQRIGIERLRIFLQGQNLFLIKDTKGKNRYYGPDPEIPGFQYPRPTNLTFGFDIVL